MIVEDNVLAAGLNCGWSFRPAFVDRPCDVAPRAFERGSGCNALLVGERIERLLLEDEPVRTAQAVKDGRVDDDVAGIEEDLRLREGVEVPRERRPDAVPGLRVFHEARPENQPLFALCVPVGFRRPDVAGLWKI